MGGIKEFLKHEASGGILLMVATIVALLCQNTFLSDFYNEFLKTKFTVSFGEYGLSKPLILWVNDGLMAVFFFLIGLELKREKIEGQLRHFSQILLPSFAALGGVIAPAVIFSIINWGDSAAMKGWAIPTATDIAFAVGVMALLGKKIPASLKIFVLTLAIMDDLCAILIIAVFYSSAINIIYLGGAAACVAIMLVMSRFGVDKKLPFIIVAIVLWVMVLNSGIHATIAGVLAGFCIPLKTR